MKRWSLRVFPLFLVLILVSCGSTEEGTGGSENEEETTTGEENQEQTDSEKPPETITVQLKDSDGKEVGTAELEQEDQGVDINLVDSSLPEGMHGFHIHEKGSCEAPDFKSSGCHFNPTDVSHGTESEDGPHAGDLPNIEAGEDGSVQKEVTADQVTLKKGEKNSLLKEGGTALVIHSKADDNKSQPSGDAGERIACGVIEK
ncbi:superoxide dismutase family protein [Halobacillus mangrovi]|uniref:Superoxide dismutase [Cu-Zn] n=1 Tax=Halobacillus mangrovi TaxID=402384 RepID=A0A1W5ZZ06_9BACI|nr:superoxide dismutase family protein [Halobacillus mangrovi]ARI78512.1 superoxide dismutase [Halobacillus mangrovi]